MGSLAESLTLAIQSASVDSNERPLYLALSGGLDSSLLLHICAHNPSIKNRLTAIHVNHGLFHQADAWQAECHAMCETLGVDFIAQNVELENTGEGVEQAARKARYQVFEQCLPPKALLLMAHHASDQAETFLYRAFRGSGLQGLGAIPKLRLLTSAFDESRYLLRPWLTFRRVELEACAKAIDLNWVEDESNLDTHFDRNWVRHQLLPSIESRFPSVETTLARNAQLLQQDAILLEELLAPYFDKVFGEAHWPATATTIIRLEVLKSFQPKIQEQVIRQWFKRLGLMPPQGKVVWEWLEQCLTASPDKQPLCRLKDACLQRHAQALYCWSPELLNLPDAKVLQEETPWAGGVISIAPSLLNQLEGAYLVSAVDVPNANVAIKNRPTKSLKHIWQEHSVPVWLRASWPLLMKDDQCLAVVGLAQSKELETDNRSLSFL